MALRNLKLALHRKYRIFRESFFLKKKKKKKKKERKKPFIVLNFTRYLTGYFDKETILLHYLSDCEISEVDTFSFYIYVARKIQRN